MENNSLKTSQNRSHLQCKALSFLIFQQFFHNFFFHVELHFDKKNLSKLFKFHRKKNLFYAFCWRVFVYFFCQCILLFLHFPFSILTTFSGIFFGKNFHSRIFYDFFVMHSPRYDLWIIIALKYSTIGEKEREREKRENIQSLIIKIYMKFHACLWNMTIISRVFRREICIFCDVDHDFFVFFFWRKQILFIDHKLKLFSSRRKHE